MNLGAPVAAAAAGVPAVCHSLGVAIPPEWTVPGLHVLDAALAAEGPALVEGVLDVDVRTGDRYLDVMPPSLQVPPVLQMPERRPLRPVAWSDPAPPLPAVVTRRRDQLHQLLVIMKRRGPSGGLFSS